MVPASERFPSELREEIHQGEIIGKRRVRIKVIERVNFPEHLCDSERWLFRVGRSGGEI